MVLGASGRGFEAVFRGLVPIFLRFAWPLRVCVGFVIAVSFAFGVGDYRGCSGFASSVFLVSRLALGLLLRRSFVFLFSYSGVSYIDHSAKLTMFYM